MRIRYLIYKFKAYYRHKYPVPYDMYCLSKDIKGE